MKAISALAVAATTVMISASAPAADVEAPSGPVVLTVAGEIANTNRPAYGRKQRRLLQVPRAAFDRAFEFDLAMLEGLGMTEVRIEYRDWNAPIDFSGPRLADVLSAAGLRQRTARHVGARRFRDRDGGGGDRDPFLGARDTGRRTAP